MEYGFLGGGFLLLILGSEAAVRGGVAVARALGVSPLLIGLFVIAAATSAPELAVSLQAGIVGASDIALGNVVGSNILNILLILGLGALIRPMPSPPKVVLRDGGAMLTASVVLALMAWGHEITRNEGIFLLLLFAAYVATAFITDWRRPPEQSVACASAVARMAGGETSGSVGFFILLFGLVCLYLGAHFTVAGGIRVASTLGFSQALVGLTIVAFCTSVPELVLTIVAAVRGQTELAVGHLVGASTFNILAVIGLTSVIHPLAVSTTLAGVDVLVMLAASAILLPMLATNWRLSRPQGALLLFCYLGYVAFLAWRQGLLTPAMLGAG
jgi:cation:H+ antiporter